jgi:hypothetical protein
MSLYSFFLLNVDYTLLIILGLVLTVFLLIKRKKVELHKLLFPLIYLIMYKTKWGLKSMDKFAKKISKRTKNILTYTSITTGFIGMAFILVTFLQSVYRYFFIERDMVVAPLLPGATIPGLPKLSFLHWIIAIFILAAVHEFSHGLFARMHGIKVKSSGFAFFGILLPIIPAAFVEPDEKQMVKASKKKQLAVLSAGTFANFITAFVFFIILMFVMSPLAGMAIAGQQGVVVGAVDDGGPAEMGGLPTGERILDINGQEINNLEEFFLILNSTVAYEKIDVRTDQGEYTITLGEHPQGEERGYIGLQLTPVLGWSGKLIIWLNILVYWLFLTNLMVGLINLLPMGMVDGGRMFYLALLTFIKKEKTANKIFGAVSIILLLLLLVFLIPALYNYFTAPFIK